MLSGVNHKSTSVSRHSHASRIGWLSGHTICFFRNPAGSVRRLPSLGQGFKFRGLQIETPILSNKARQLAMEALCGNLETRRTQTDTLRSFQICRVFCHYVRCLDEPISNASKNADATYWGEGACFNECGNAQRETRDQLLFIHL